MEGMPHAVVLENDLEEMFILLAATAMPVRPVVPGSIFATKVRDSKPNQTTMLVLSLTFSLFYAKTNHTETSALTPDTWHLTPVVSLFTATHFLPHFLPHFLASFLTSSLPPSLPPSLPSSLPSSFHRDAHPASCTGALRSSRPVMAGPPGGGATLPVPRTPIRGLRIHPHPRQRPLSPPPSLPLPQLWVCVPLRPRLR